MATLRDIAQQMGLSESTVSRVLNNKGRVSASTKKKVLAYADQIQYHPNQMAKSLKLQAANSLGVVVPDISNEFYALLFKEIDHRVSGLGYTPILFNIGDDVRREQAFLGQLRSSTVDGLVVATSGSSAYASLPASLMRRIVFVDNLPSGGPECSYVGADNVKSSYALTQHLIERGHTRIATIVGPAGESSALERLEGFEQCLADNSLSLPRGWIARTNFQYADGWAKAKSLLERKNPPTAIIAQNNVLAYATIGFARTRNLRVPRDVAVACFDHLDTYGFMRPVITSMVQPLDQIAEKAWELLRAGISGESHNALHRFEASFQLGETT